MSWTDDAKPKKNENLITPGMTFPLQSLCLRSPKIKFIYCFFFFFIAEFERVLVKNASTICTRWNLYAHTKSYSYGCEKIIRQKTLEHRDLRKFVFVLHTYSSRLRTFILTVKSYLFARSLASRAVCPLNFWKIGEKTRKRKEVGTKFPSPIQHKGWLSFKTDKKCAALSPWKAIKDHIIFT